MERNNLNGDTMTKYICAFCEKESTSAERAFDHLIEKHGDILQNRYIMED